MERIRTLLIGGVVGAAATYFFDPELGAGRRARLQDQLAAGVRDGRRSLEDAARQLQERIEGLPTTREADDLTILGRVERALLGVQGLPRRSVDAEVIDGQLVLRGDVASAEQEREVIEAAGDVSGVEGVESHLRLPGEGILDGPAPGVRAEQP
jgi:osmotically-inducible protein OsmY